MADPGSLGKCGLLRGPVTRWRTILGPGTVSFRAIGDTCGLPVEAVLEGAFMYLCRGHAEEYQRLPPSPLNGKVRWL